MKVFTKSIFAIGLVSTSISAFGWNATGHMIVADIASGLMTSHARLEAQQLLSANPEDNANTIVDCAPWADDIRTKATGSWHYIDQYFRTDGKSTDLQPDTENVVWAINHFSVILKNKSASSHDRAEALRFLIHFVGDIHQPLHCVSKVTDDLPKGDLGGNKFYFSHPEGKTRPHELHYFWDDGGGIFVREARPIEGAYKVKLDGLAHQALGSLSPAQLHNASEISSPAAWSKEGLELSKTFVYSTPEFQEPDDHYTHKTQIICLQRVAIAGERLAKLLDKLLD